MESSARDNIAEADINLLLDIIEDDDWVLQWPEDHLKECNIGRLASDAEMQSLGTRIRRKLPKVKVESLGLMPSYAAAPTYSSPTQIVTEMPEADFSELKDQNAAISVRMDKMDGSLTQLHGEGQRDSQVLLWIAKKLDKNNTFDEPSAEEHDPEGEAVSRPSHSPRGTVFATPTPLVQRPSRAAQDHTEVMDTDGVPETQASPDPSRLLSLSDAATPAAGRNANSRDNRRATLSRGIKTGLSGYMHVARKTNVNETNEWIVVRIILLCNIDERKWWGKLVDYSLSTPPILVQSAYWYADEEDSTAALASRMAAKRTRKQTLSP